MSRRATTSKAMPRAAMRCRNLDPGRTPQPRPAAQVRGRRAGRSGAGLEPEKASAGGRTPPM